jgi:hypothetical protein
LDELGVLTTASRVLGSFKTCPSSSRVSSATRRSCVVCSIMLIPVAELEQPRYLGCNDHERGPPRSCQYPCGDYSIPCPSRRDWSRVSRIVLEPLERLVEQ